MIIDREEGSGSGILLLVVVLIVLFGMFRGGGSAFGSSCPTADAVNGGLGGLTTAADLMTFNRYTNYMDPELARIQREQAEGTGQILKEQAVDAGAIMAELERKSCEMEVAVNRSIENQNRVALESERQFNTYVVNQKDEKIAEQRLAMAELNAKILHQETMTAMALQTNAMDRRLDSIQCNMLQRPPYYGCGGVPYVNQCAPVSGCGTSCG